MAKGGRQPGAGRPKASTNVPRFANYITEADRKIFVEYCKKKPETPYE
jgi:hypothetical protein